LNCLVGRNDYYKVRSLSSTICRIRTMRLTEILAWLNEEIDRLHQARDLLAGKPAGSRGRQKRTVSARKAAPALKKAAKVRGPELPVPVYPTKAAEPTKTTQRKARAPVHRVARPRKTGITSGALSGPVPAGPVAVSAHEARKAQERAAGPQPEVLPTEDVGGAGEERSLGSLIRAFVRREAHGGSATS
jgi:hypothetical protein